MISGGELTDGYVDTINRIDTILSREDLGDEERKGYQRLRDDCTWFIRHLSGEEGDCYD